MARTTITAVKELLSSCYDGSSALTPYIDSATAVVSRVATCATTKGKTLTTVELELIERWLAAHFYTKMDPVYAQKRDSAGNGSLAMAHFVRDPKEPEPFLNGAMNLDYSGCLTAIIKRQTARVVWMGKPPSSQIDYVDRD